MKISLGSWAFSFGPFADHPIPFEKTVKRLSEAGYDGIEICGFPPHVTLEDYPTKESRRELVRFLKDHRLGVSGYAADLSFVNPVTVGYDKKYLDLFKRNVEMAVDIGSPSIRVDTVAAPGSIDESDYQSSFDRLAYVWKDAAEIARDAGVRMVWEFEPGFAFNKPSEIVAMHEKVGHPNFALMFDTSHAYMCGVVGARQHGEKEVVPSVSAFLRKLAGRIGAIHLIDSDGTLHGDETSTHCPFGQGFIDFKALAPQLLAVPNIQWWCIDMCFWAGSWELVESSRAFVADLLGRKVAA
jgi:sugar phosphate isomerase/epimerase